MSVQNGAFTRTNSFGQDAARNRPRFHTEEVEDMVASERAGRPIFRTEERVEIFMPSNVQTRPVFKVTPEYIQRWPEEYAAFKKGLEAAVDGTPLEQWPPLKRAQVLELKALGFMTVEEIASASDLMVQRIGMGALGLRNLAKAFLDDAEAGALNMRLTADSQRKDEQIADLSRKVEELGALLDRTHSDLQSMRNAPSALATTVPSLTDPIAQARSARPVEEPAESALSSFDMAPRRKPGRPRKNPEGGDTGQAA